MAAEDRRCCGDPFTVAPRLRRRSRTSVSRLELWSRGAIRRDHAARQCSAALLGRVHGRVAALCTPCSPLWDACSPPVHQILCLVNCSAKQCLFSRVHARTALLDHGSDGMTFSRFQAWLKPCLGSLEQGTGQQCLWTLWRRVANHDLSAGDLPAGARYYAACGWHSGSRTQTHTHTRPPPPPPPTHLLRRRPATPRHPTDRPHAPHPCQPHPTAPPHRARVSPRLRRPSTTAVFPRASSPRAVPSVHPIMGAPHRLPSPPSTPPTLSPSGHTQIDHATVPAHAHLSCISPVPLPVLCNASQVSSEGG